MTRIRQLAFPFPQHASYAAADFIPAACNAEAMAWLARPQDWPGGRLAVFGPAGSGKTHLLHVFAARSGGTLLPGEAVRHLVEMPASGGLAVDDADAAPEPEALLHLLNAAAENGLPVLLAGREPPARWPTTLPDLASRLRAVTPVGLGQPDDGLLRALLARLLAERQLRVESLVQDYLLARLPRHGAALREAACRLDRVSLASGGAVTRNVAAEVLNLMGQSGPDDGVCGDPLAAGSPVVPDSMGPVRAETSHAVPRLL